MTREQEEKAELLAADSGLPLSVAQEVIATGSGAGGCLGSEDD